MSAAPGEFGPEARELIMRLEAAGIVLVVLGSPRGSGVCFDLNVKDKLDARAVALHLVTLLRDLADKLETKVLVEGFPPDDPDQHEQKEQ